MEMCRDDDDDVMWNASTMVVHGDDDEHGDVDHKCQ